jgi:hypothetical protein
MIKVKALIALFDVEKGHKGFGFVEIGQEFEVSEERLTQLLEYKAVELVAVAPEKIKSK